MALPFAPPPHDLSTDDVYPAELAEKVRQACNDTVDLLGAEHVNTGPRASEHDVVVVPVAVAIVIPPHYRSPALSYATNGQQEYGAPPVGFSTPPTWEWRGGYVVSSFELEPDLLLLAARCTVQHGKAVGSLTASNSESLAPRFVQAGPRAGAFHLGWLDASYWIERFTIVVRGRRRT